MSKVERLNPMGELQGYPPPEKWDDWVEYDPKSWPEKVEHHYTVVPTVCFNCEAACGLLAYVEIGAMCVGKIVQTHPPERPFERGSVGMALAGKDTGGSQFFITLAPQPHLDGGFTCFGRVIAGMQVVDLLTPDDRIRSVTIEEDRAALQG